MRSLYTRACNMPTTPPPAAIAQVVVEAILKQRTARRICEANAASLELSSIILSQTNDTLGTATYDVLPYREDRIRPPWPAERTPARVMTPSSRTIRGPVEARLGLFDTIIVGMDSILSGLRVSVLMDIPLLLQHTAPRSLVIMHGPKCSTAREDNLYRGGFFIGNLTVPCWQDYFWELTEVGALWRPVCRSLDDRGRILNVMSTKKVTGDANYLVCQAMFRRNASLCAREPPLLERLAQVAPFASPSQAASRERPCNVRKERVTMDSASRSWRRMGVKHESLSHQLRRHVRYYSVHRCNEDQVCLIFKSEIDEQWVAGLNSSDGLQFRGDPALVMPRIAIAEQLHEALLMVLRPNNASNRQCSPRRGGLNRRADRYCESGALKGGMDLMVGSMTHNLAMARHKGKWLAVGGRHGRQEDTISKDSSFLVVGSAGARATPGWWRPIADLVLRKVGNKTGTMEQALGPKAVRRLDLLPQHLRNIPRMGIWMTHAPLWHYTAAAGKSETWLNVEGGVDEPMHSPWREKHLILDGKHPGCVERRETVAAGIGPYRGTCEFDGRLALVSFGNELLLYTRSNPKSRGARHVQLTRSRDDGESWSAFEQVQIDGYAGTGDIYFFGVQVNPAHNGSLLAVFPIAHRARGCIALSLSLDGGRWSRAVPLLSCSIFGERTLDQPASPAMIRRGAEIWLYVQEEVPSVTIEQRTPRLVYAQMDKAQVPSTVMRYAFPCTFLANWTADTLRDRHRRSEPGSASVRFSSSCADDVHHINPNDRATSSRPAPSTPKGCVWSTRAPDVSYASARSMTRKHARAETRVPSRKRSRARTNKEAAA